jgi:hypothetical protein
LGNPKEDVWKMNVYILNAYNTSGEVFHMVATLDRNLLLKLITKEFAGYSFEEDLELEKTKLEEFLKNRDEDLLNENFYPYDLSIESSETKKCGLQFNVLELK